MNIYGGELKADYFYDNGHTIRYKKLTDEDIKFLFQNIKMNTGFPLPERIVQDLIQDESIEPTFKKCTMFNKKDLCGMVEPLKKKKHKKKNLPKHKTKKNKDKGKSQGKGKDKDKGKYKGKHKDEMMDGSKKGTQNLKKKHIKKEH